MLSRMRFLFASLFLGMFLVACGANDDSAETDAQESAITEQAAPRADDAAPEAAAAPTTASHIIEPGTTRAELIAKYGEPTESGERRLDTMEIEILEWQTDEGLVFAQLVDGKVTFGRLVTEE